MASHERAYDARGTYEWKLTEIVYLCWQARCRAKAEGRVNSYIASVESFYFVLPERIKEAVKPYFLELRENSNLGGEEDPLKSYRVRKELMLKKADRLLNAIVNLLDQNGLLVKMMPTWRINNPEVFNQLRRRLNKSGDNVG